MPIRSRKTYFNYAVAASIAGMIGVGLFFMTTSNTGEKNNLASLLEEANVILKNGAFDSEMEKLSDDDIVNYLNLNGSDVNAALVASISDDKKLPNEEEYLYDDQTLDNFLKEINIKKVNLIIN